MELFFPEKMRKYSWRIMLLVFATFIFIVLPFIRTVTTIDPELTPRFLLTSVFVIVFSFFLFFTLRHSTTFDRQAGKIAGIIIAILLWTALSIFRSINTGDAYCEWLRLSILYSIFFISYLIFQNVPGYFVVFSRIVAIGVIIFSVFGFLQFNSILSDYTLGKSPKLNFTISSAFGNKNLFSEVLVLFLPFLINGIFSNRKWWRILIAASLMMDLFFIAIQQTVAAWIAILVSAICLIILSRRFEVRLFDFSIKRKYLISISIIAIVIVVAGFILFRQSSNYDLLRLKVNSTLEYIKDPSLLSITREENNNSVFERLLLWRNSGKMIADHPVFGAGLNNWKIYNPSYGIGGTDFTNSGFLNYEHPHNDYLLVWAEQGPAGLILFLTFFYLVIRNGIRKMKDSDSKTKRFLLFLICGVIAFMVLSLFAYPRSRFYPMLLLMMTSAMISAIPGSKNKKVSILPIAIILVLISVFGSSAANNRLNGEIHNRNLIISQLQKNFARMIREADKSYSWYFPLDLTGTPINWYKGIAWFYSGERTQAIREFEKALIVNPNHLRLLNDIATSYQQNNESGKAIYYYRRALEITPLFVEANLNLSATYFNIGKIDSSFYFIDRIYYTKNINNEKSYKPFLDAILHEKALNIIHQDGDSIAVKKMLPLISNPDSLKNIYDHSKSENKNFSEYLLSISK